MTAQQTVLLARALDGFVDPTSRYRLIPRGHVVSADDPAVKEQPERFLIGEAHELNDVAWREARRAYLAALAAAQAERDAEKEAKAAKERERARAAEQKRVKAAADKAQVAFVGRIAETRHRAAIAPAEAERAATAAEQKKLARQAQVHERDLVQRELKRRLEEGELDTEIEHAQAALARGGKAVT